MKTIVYVDWFNFYHRIVKYSTYQWLDISMLFKSMLRSEHEIVKIKFFTAKLKVLNNDLSALQEQENYHNAIKTYIPNVEFYFGKFIQKTVQVPPHIRKSFPGLDKFNSFEEKGTDVNLAIEMLNDSWLNKFDCAVLLSNDGDFAGVLEKIKSRKNTVVGLFTPGKSRVSFQLSPYATFRKRITISKLKNNQLPTKIPNSEIIKPKHW